MTAWHQLARLTAEQRERLTETVYREYGLAFKPLAVQGTEVVVELKDGRKVKIDVGS